MVSHSPFPLSLPHPGTFGLFSNHQSLQGHEKQIEDDFDGYLLESWPDDPGEAGLGSAIRGLGFLFAEARYPDGAMLVKSGASLVSIFYLEQGEVEVTYPEQPDQDTLSDDDDVSLSDFF